MDSATVNRVIDGLRREGVRVTPEHVEEVFNAAGHAEQMDRDLEAAGFRPVGADESGQMLVANPLAGLGARINASGKVAVFAMPRAIHQLSPSRRQELEVQAEALRGKLQSSTISAVQRIRAQQELDHLEQILKLDAAGRSPISG